MRGFRNTAGSPRQGLLGRALPLLLASALAATACAPQRVEDKITAVLAPLTDAESPVFGFDVNFNDDYSRPRHRVNLLVNGRAITKEFSYSRGGVKPEFDQGTRVKPLTKPKPLAGWDLAGIGGLFEQTCPGPSEWDSRVTGRVTASLLPSKHTLVSVDCDADDPEVTRIGDYDVPDLKTWTTPEALGTLLQEVPIVTNTDKIRYLDIAPVGNDLGNGMATEANIGLDIAGPSGEPCLGSYTRSLQNVAMIESRCDGPVPGNPLADPIDIASLDPSQVAAAFENAAAQAGQPLILTKQASLLNASTPYVKVVWEHAEVAVSLDGTILRHETKD